MAARQPPAILFHRCHLDLSCSFLSPPYLRSCLADHYNLPDFATCSVVNQIYKIWSEIWVASSPSPEIRRPKNIKISVWVRTTLRLDYLQNTTQHRQIQTTDTPAQANLIWFTLVHPTGGHHAGHCHASSVIVLYYYYECYFYHQNNYNTVAVTWSWNVCFCSWPHSRVTVDLLSLSALLSIF